MARFASRVTGKNNKQQQGFTIVELMIVMLILGILVSIVVMTMQVSKSKAQQAACKANLRVISDAITQYEAAHSGQSPPTLDTLVTDSPPYIKSSFQWKCPAGDFGLQSGDYRDYYDSSTGETSCPRKNHNP